MDQHYQNSLSFLPKKEISLYKIGCQYIFLNISKKNAGITVDRNGLEEFTVVLKLSRLCKRKTHLIKALYNIQPSYNHCFVSCHDRDYFSSIILFIKHQFRHHFNFLLPLPHSLCLT